MWRAKTSNLLATVVSLEKGSADADRREFSSALALDIDKWLRPLTNSKSDVVCHELGMVIEQCINLDKEISNQVAGICWEFPSRRLCDFDSRIMNPQQGQTSPPEGQTVVLVVAPGLVKCGRSSGDDFDVEYRLLQMQCYCIPRNWSEEELKMAGAGAGCAR
jgi:hypothetical protein